MEVDQITKALTSYVLNTITDTDLEQTLKQAVQRTLTDPSFRLNLGTNTTFWETAHTILTRNVTAANPSGQTLALEYGVIHTLAPLILCYLPQLDTFSALIVRVSTQAACNMVTGSEAILDTVWKSWCLDQQPPLWNQVIESNDKDTVTSGLILISQCIRNNKDRCGNLVTTSGGIAYLKAVVEEIDRAHTEETNQHFELGYIIVSELLKNGYFVDALQVLEDPESSDEINQHQTVIVKLFDSTLYKHPEISIPISTKDLEKLSGLLCLLSNQACQVINHAVTTHRDHLSNLELDKVSLMYTCLVLLLQIINLLLTLTTTHGKEMKSILLAHNGLSAIIELLRQCETMVEWKDKEKSKLGFDYVKREIVKCIGALCYKDKDTQDKVRTLGGLSMILNQMKIDDTNPYIREHATVTLRYLLEGNSENQQMIQDMTPIQAVQNDELNEMGLNASLVDGKVHLEQSRHRN
ncbi:unnamed protein product [Absidia cylindrospora]